MLDLTDEAGKIMGLDGHTLQSLSRSAGIFSKFMIYGKGDPWGRQRLTLPAREFFIFVAEGGEPRFWSSRTRWRPPGWGDATREQTDQDEERVLNRDESGEEGSWCTRTAEDRPGERTIPARKWQIRRRSATWTRRRRGRFWRRARACGSHGRGLSSTQSHSRRDQPGQHERVSSGGDAR